MNKDYNWFKEKAYQFYRLYDKNMLVERIAMLELQLFRLQQQEKEEKENKK